MTKYAGADDLALPGPASLAAREAFSGALRARTQAALAASFRELPEGDRIRAALGAAWKENPAPLFAAVRRTSVHVHFEAARIESDRVGHLRAGACALLAELASAEALPSPITLDAPPRVLVRSRRRALALGGETVFARGAVTVGGRAAEETLSHVPIEDDICLAREDDNPLAMNEAHPDKDGNALTLGGHPEEEWIRSLSGCLLRIGEHLPELRAEMALGLQQVVPVGFDPQRHLSASYREALGTIYLTLHPDPMTMTEAVIHEFQHNKLNAALDLDPFLENAFDELVSSPVRPDPRPLHGVLLAVHAFQPVAELYLRMKKAGDPIAARPRFDERLGEIVRGNHEGLSTLDAHARPTAIGRRLLSELSRIDARHRASVA